MRNQVWARLSGAMGILFVVGFIVLGALSGNSPDYKSSDSDITAWYASHSHRARDIAGIFILAVSATFFSGSSVACARRCELSRAKADAWRASPLRRVRR